MVITPWSELLNEVIAELEATTAGGCPPGCAPAATMALDAFARHSGVHIPESYRILLVNVNGFTIGDVRIYGLGVPMLDVHLRDDFLLKCFDGSTLNGPGPHDRWTRFGSVGQMELVHKAATDSFELQAPDRLTGELRFQSFDDLCSAVLESRGAGLAAA